MATENQASSKSGGTSLIVTAVIAVLVLATTALMTLQFIDGKKARKLKMRMNMQQTELKNLSDKLSMALGEETGEADPDAENPGQAAGSGNKKGADNGEPRIVTRTTVMESLKKLAAERQFLIDEVKRVGEQVEHLTSRFDQMAMEVKALQKGPPATKTVAAPKPKPKKPGPRYELLRRLAGHQDVIHAVRFSPDGAQLATASSDQTIRVWDMDSGAVMHTLTGHVASVSDLSYSPDGKWLVSSSWDRTIKLWHPSSGAQIRTFLGHTQPVQHVRFAPRGDLIASAGSQAMVNFWDPMAGEQLTNLKRPPWDVRTLAFSPSGDLLAFVTDRQIKLWHNVTQRAGRTLDEHTAPIRAIAFSLDGKYLVSGGDDKVVRLWSVATGKLIREFRGHKKTIHDLSLSPDGKLLVSSSDDGMVVLWQVKDGSVAQRLEAHSGSVAAVAFSPDGNWLASAGEDKTVRLWRSLPRI